MTFKFPVLISVALLSVVALRSGPALAQNVSDVPHTISYQGVLTDSAGLPLEGMQTITVRMYASEADTQAVWADTFTVTTTRGMFQVLLGAQHALPLFSSPLWLGITVGNGAELLPRTSFGASPYALAIANGTVTAAKMATNYVAGFTVNGDTIAGNNVTVALEGWPHRAVLVDSAGSIQLGAPQDIDSSASPNFNNLWLAGAFHGLGDITISNNVFTVNAVTGNTSFIGDLTINNGIFTVLASSGNTIVGGTFNCNGTLSVADSFFTVDALTGNTFVGGTFNTIGDFSVNNNLFTVNALTGNTIVGGTFNTIGDFSVNNSLFTVNALTGNTIVGGTFNTIGDFSVNNNLFTVNALTGNTIVGGTFNTIGDFSVNNSLFTVNALTGNTIVGGTFNTIGDFSVNNNLFTVNALTGNTIVGGTFNTIGDFSVNNNLFTVNALTGNTIVGGTLVSTGDFTVANNIFNVNVANNSTSIMGDVVINNGLFNISSTNNAITVGGTLNMTNNFSVANNLFTVNAVSGNTLIGGTLNIANTLSIVNGVNTWFSVNGGNGNTIIGGTLNVSGGSTFSGALNMGSQAITNVAAPVAAGDAATKAYVDGRVASMGGRVAYELYKSGYTIADSNSVAIVTAVDIAGEGTGAPATTTLPSTRTDGSAIVNGQTVIVTTDDPDGLSITAGANNYIIPDTKALRFMHVGASWRVEN